MLAVRVSRARRARHRKFRGATRGGGRPRLERLDSWLDARETELTGTATLTTVDSVGANGVNFAAPHPFADFDVVRVTSTLTVPTGLSEAEDYFVDDEDPLAIAFTSTARMRRENGKIGLEDAGSGVISVEPSARKNAIIGWLRSRLPVQIQNATDIDNL